MRNTAKLYLRLSKDEPGQTSIADQERECRRLADREAISDIRVYTEDPGTSGYKDVARPVFDDLIATLQPGDLVMAWNWERISRKGMEQSGFVERRLQESGAHLVTVIDGIDTRRDGFEVNLAMRALMANQYSKTLSKNVKRGKETGAVAGKWNGGKQWDGWAVDPDGVWRGPKVIDDTRAKIYYEVLERYVAGESIYGVVNDLTSRGIRTLSGAVMKPENVLRFMLNKRNIGIRVHNGVEHPGDWPRLFTPEQRAELLAAKDTADRMAHWPTGKTGARTYLLSGLLTCGRPGCGAPMRGAQQHGVRSYRCHKCNQTIRKAEPIELLVTDGIFFRSETPALGKLLAYSNPQGGDIHRLTSEIEAKTLVLVRLADDYADGTFDKAEYLRQKQRATTAKEAAERSLQREMSKRTGIKLEPGQTVRAWFAGATLEQRRRLVVLFAPRIIVKPSDTAGMKRSELWHGHRFKPQDIVIEWADAADAATPLRVEDPAILTAEAALLHI